MEKGVSNLTGRRKRTQLFSKTDVLLILAYSIIVIGLNLVVAFVLPDFVISLSSAIAAIPAVAIFLIARRQQRLEQFSQRKSDYQQLETFFQLRSLIPSALPLPGLRWSAASPDIMAVLYKQIMACDPTCLVECGAGSSTIWLGRIVQSVGSGHLFSLEHDKEWYTHVSRMIEDHGLHEHVSLLYAPLTLHQAADKPLYWYSTDELEAELQQHCKIDLLFVDGPPDSTPRARYPAVPILRPWMAENCIIVMDDTHRKEEGKTAEQWANELNYRVEQLETEKGTHILLP
jgi:predicted O-methyltransferase YrrM